MTCSLLPLFCPGSQSDPPVHPKPRHHHQGSDSRRSGPEPMIPAALGLKKIKKGHHAGGQNSVTKLSHYKGILHWNVFVAPITNDENNYRDFVLLFPGFTGNN